MTCESSGKKSYGESQPMLPFEQRGESSEFCPVGGLSSDLSLFHLPNSFHCFLNPIVSSEVFFQTFKKRFDVLIDEFGLFIPSRVGRINEVFLDWSEPLCGRSPKASGD